jgi:hypothetical protein
VNGVERCFCKAKYNDARDIGVQHDSIGGTFFIDRVRCPCTVVEFRP